MGGDAGAEVGVERRLDVVPVLEGDRPVEPVLLLVLLDELGRRPLAEQRLGRASRERVNPREDEDRDPDQDRHEEQQPADDEAKHRVSSSAGLLATTYCPPTQTGANGSVPIGLAT
jgi:hypothetical protein